VETRDCGLVGSTRDVVLAGPGVRFSPWSSGGIPSLSKKIFPRQTMAKVAAAESSSHSIFFPILAWRASGAHASSILVTILSLFFAV
jgi:hypothetical protein